MAKNTFLNEKLGFDNLQDLKYHLDKEKSNNSNICRKMSILSTKGGSPELVANILVNTLTGCPMLSIPKTSFNAISIIDVESKKPQQLTKYNDLIFTEFLTSRDELDIPLDLYEQLLESRSTLEGVPKTSRYKPILEVTNPNTGMQYTFFLDVFHRDIFAVCGLNFILEDTVKPISGTINAYQHVDGFNVICCTDPFWRFRATSITSLISTPAKDIVSNSIRNLNWDMTLPNLKAYFIPCNKDVIINNGTNIVPTIFDKILSPNREIQIAKYPILVIEFGTSADLLTEDRDLDTIGHYLIQSDINSRLSCIYNGNKYTNKTVFGVAIAGI